MLTVPDAVGALKEALKKKGVERHVLDSFNHLASCLVLLDSSSPSVQMIRKLCTVLRRPFLPLYNACLQPALRLSCTVLSMVLGRLCDASNVESETLREEWDATATAILSGILDFLDQKDNGKVQSDSVAWEALNRVICEFFFHDSGRGVFSVSLCLSAYNTLTETATKQLTVGNALRHKTILGGERLGVVISRTRDYLTLEALLVLVARLLPPIRSTSQGKSQRIKFVKEIFGSLKLFDCSSELLDIMQRTSETHWDDIAAQIIDVLARSDITYPQPFSIDEIDVCGRVFPQPLATDRLIVDSKAFLANIVVENVDLCESLQIPYSHIRTITLDNAGNDVPEGKVLIVVHLTSPPLVAGVEMKYPTGSRLYAKFLVQENAVGRYMEALRRRGVGKLSFLNPLTRTRKNISIGSGLKFIKDSSPILPTASFEGKVQHVSQVYKTDLAVSDPVFVPTNGDLLSTATPGPKSASDDPGSAVSDDGPITPPSAPLIPSANEKLNQFLLPGDSTLLDDGDELSEISEFEPNEYTVKEQATTGLSASHNPELKQPQATINFVLANENTGPQLTRKSCDSVLETGDRTLSITHINISPRPVASADALSTSVGSEMVSRPSTASKECVGTDMPKDIGDGKRDPSHSEFAIPSTGKPQIGLGSVEGEPQQHASDAKPQLFSAITEDTHTPPKVSGSRRKRESIKPSRKIIIGVDDEPSPPRKKRREDRSPAFEDNDAKPEEISPAAISALTTKRPTIKAENLSRTVNPITFDPHRSPEQTYQGTRKSSRKKVKQIAINARANGLYGKTKKRRKVDDSSANANLHGVMSTPDLRPTSILVKASPMQPDTHMVVAKLDCVENPSLNMTPPRGMLKDGNPHPCEPIITEAKEFSFAQNTISNSDVVQLLEPAVHIYTGHTDIGHVREVVSLPPVARNENPVKLESTPQAKTVTIDLTIDDSPARKNVKPFTAPANIVPVETDTPATFMTPDQSGYIDTEETTFISSPRRRHRSVTFASPIEYILDKKVKLKTQVSPSNMPRKSFSTFETNALSPLGVVTGPMSMRCGSLNRTQLRKASLSQASAQNPTTDEPGIRDIVEVLNEIQAAIIKGISDKSRSVRKHTQRSRDELIKQVVDELQDMVIENAKYFNELLRLEEDYYKNGKAITRYWEELIDVNDSIAEQVQKALREHDQNACARTFPKSLRPLKLDFLSRRANT